MAVEVLAKANQAFRAGEFMESAKLLQEEDMNHPKVLSLLGLSYFYMGRFEEAYQTYHKLFMNDNIKVEELDCSIEDFDPTGRDIMNSLENLGIPEMTKRLPLMMNLDYKQSKETPKESYDELLEFQTFLTRCTGLANKDMKKASAIISDEIETMLQDRNPVIVARGWMYRAELSYRQQDYMEAYRCYLKAALTEVHKALYYGYAANMLMKCLENDKNLVGLATILTYRAIELDFTNAKWHYNQGLNLMSLAKLFSQTGLGHPYFLHSAKNEFLIGSKVLYPEQEQLKAQIQTMYEDVCKITDKI
jgi:tetratricopeptide (TPR) repeat protein